MLQAEKTTDYIEFFKTVAPWITGGLAGAILTLLAKVYSERRRRKVINISISKQRFALPKIESSNSLQPEGLTVSYKNQQYVNLSLYTAVIENTGHGGVNNQKIVFVFPSNTTFIEDYFKSSPTSLTHDNDRTVAGQKTEQGYSFSRIENGDRITIAYLIDCEELDEIKCLPRGVDDVVYMIGDQADVTEVEQTLYRFLIYLAVFVAVGSLPIIGGTLQGITILMATSSAIRLVGLFRGRPAVSTRVEIDQVDFNNSTHATLNISS